MEGWARRQKGAALVLAACGLWPPAAWSQTGSVRPPDLPVTRLEGAGGAERNGIGQQPPIQRPADLPSLPVTNLDERGADLDGSRRMSLTISRPLPLRDVLELLLTGTPLSFVFEEGVDGTFSGAITNLSMRQALEAVLFPRGLDYDVQGSLVRIFPRKAATRLFDVNYLNFRRTWQRTVRSAIDPSSPHAPAAELTTTIASDLFEELGKGVQALLSESGRMHVDRTAGLVQVTDFADRLDQVGVYVEAVQLRATRQVRIEARVFQITLADAAASSVDWKAAAARSGATVRAASGRAVGMRVESFEALKKALAEQGTVTMIAAPHVVAMNNEPAVMRAGTQGVHFTTASQLDEGGRRERTATPVAILEGLTLTVTAQIASDGIVQLSVAPTFTEKTGQSKSAAGDLLPVLQVSETDTLVRVQDGDTVVISGFLQDRQKAKTSTGLAGFFGAQARETVKSDLVILLTPTVVNPGGVEGFR